MGKNKTVTVTERPKKVSEKAKRQPKNKNSNANSNANVCNNDKGTDIPTSPSPRKRCRKSIPKSNNNRNNNANASVSKRQRVRAAPMNDIEMRDDYGETLSYIQYIPSVKYDAFIAERMGNKDVVALPGLVESSRKRLINDHGIEKALELLGQFLLMKKDMSLFCTWITDTIGIKDGKAIECYNCLLDWSDIFL